MVIDGKLVSQEIKNKIKKEIEELKIKYDKVPTLCVIQIGDNPASNAYVKGKIKDCIEVGIESIKLHYSEEITEIELINKIKELNSDDSIDGILVQLPLPNHIDEESIIEVIDPKKDVDGFHSNNISNLVLNKKCSIPCTPKGVLRLLEYYNCDISGKNCVIIGRSNIVGKPMSHLMLNNNATVTVCHSKTKDLVRYTKNADILIAAIGKPNFVTRDMVKENAFVIDVGINRIDKKLVGDCDFENLVDICNITPVPGGVGLMTRACLLENTLDIFKIKLGE